jgi:hypothetical protein
MFHLKMFVEDKHLGEVLKRLTGIALNVEHQYVPNVEKKSRPNGATNMKTVDAVELFSKELHKLGITTITGPEFRDVVVKIGLNRTSYSHFLQKLIEAGVLKKGKKEQNAMRYTLTGK